MKARSLGFTLIEVLLVVSILAILGAASTPFLSNFMLRNHTETTINMTLSSLRKAQQYALQGKNNAVWGVCLSGGNTIRLYQGSCNAPAYAENYVVPNSITVTGLSDVTFDTLRAAPSTNLTITISSAVGNKTISVTAASLIETN